MKKKRLCERIEQLENQVASLQARPQPKQCEECGVLFADKLVTYKLTVYPQPIIYENVLPMVTVNDGASCAFVHVPVLCSNCQTKQQAKSA